MTNLGLDVLLVYDAIARLAAFEPERHIVPIVDAAGRCQELPELLPAIRARLMRSDIPIFVIDGKEKIETDLLSVYRIPAEHRFKGTVHGIDACVRSHVDRSGLDLHTPAIPNSASGRGESRDARMCYQTRRLRGRITGSRLTNGANRP